MSGMALIIIYGKPGCVQCRATERALDKAGIAFRKVDLTTNADALAWVTEDLGYTQAPVVYVEDGSGQSHWSGFRPDRVQVAATWVRSRCQEVEMPTPKRTAVRR